MAGKYPASKQLALGKMAPVSMTVRQKKAMVHTPWNVCKKKKENEIIKSNKFHQNSCYYIQKFWKNDFAVISCWKKLSLIRKKNDSFDRQVLTMWYQGILFKKYSREIAVIFWIPLKFFRLRLLHLIYWKVEQSKYQPKQWSNDRKYMADCLRVTNSSPTYWFLTFIDASHFA